MCQPTCLFDSELAKSKKAGSYLKGPRASVYKIRT